MERVRSASLQRQREWYEGCPERVPNPYRDIHFTMRGDFAVVLSIGSKASQARQARQARHADTLDAAIVLRDQWEQEEQERKQA
jgi:hypothetical protein